MVLLWTKLDPIHPRMLCAKFDFKLAQWFWRKRFLNFVNVFSLFRNYLLLEKGWALHLNKLESPLPKDALFGWNRPSGSWEEVENRKSLQMDGQTDRQTMDERRSEKLTWAFSSGELKSSNVFSCVEILQYLSYEQIYQKKTWNKHWRYCFSIMRKWDMPYNYVISAKKLRADS